VTILAIDQGTSATKAIVFDGDGSVLSVVEVPVAVRPSLDGAVEVDPAELLASVLAAGRQALAQAHAGQVDCIGLANQGETIVAWDRSTGDPVGPAIVWQDRRSSGLSDSLAAHSQRLAQLTGLELDPYFVAPKIAWLRPQVGNDVEITTSDTWLIHQLTGAFVTDVATAGRTMLCDLDTLRWSGEAADIFGIDADGLPTIVENASTVGTTVMFGRDTAVSGLCVDQQAALYAERCHAPGEAKCTYGTGAFLLATTDGPVRSTNGLVGCAAWQVSGVATWCLDGQVYTAGSALSWLQHIGILHDTNDLDLLACDPGDTVFVPALAGLAAPFWRPDARGMWSGLSLATSRAEMISAVVEGVCAQIALLAQCVAADQGRAIDTLRVDGGMTRSRSLLQRQADLLQAPVEVFPSAHATALGVAAFAHFGHCGEHLPLPVAIDVVEPHISSDEAHSRLERWRKVALHA
jgi:glycerol kinase